MIFVMLLWQNGGVGKVRVWEEIARKGPVAKDPESHDWIFLSQKYFQVVKLRETKPIDNKVNASLLESHCC